MNASSVWHTPGHADRYRERVYAERARLAAEHTDLPGTQRRVLADLLEFNSGTEFGRQHGFGRIRTMDEFRAAVPVRDYAAHAPLIERTAAGERGLLTADAPEVYFTSSGSTGAHKKVPVTPRFMSTTFMPFYYAAWAPLIEHFPEVLQRPDAVLNLKHDPLTALPTTGDGRPHVGASQVDFGARFGEPLSAEPGTGAPWAVLLVPTDPGDHLERAYLRLRLAVQSEVRCLIGINPAMIAAVPHQLNLWWPRIVKEVRDGTLGGLPYGAPDPERAARLERLADYFGTVRPAHVWPRLRALFCWTTGVASLYLPALREEFGGDVTALPAPVAASEGPTGVALDRHGSAGSLVASASVYEFVPADEDLLADSTTLLPHEIEAGQDYHVIFSHVGGFYRYAVGDVVSVVDRVGGVPRVEYAGRGVRSDVAGERLRDAQVVRALHTALRSGGLGLRNVACRVEPETDDIRRYVFAIAPRTPWRPHETARFTAELDRALATESAGYGHARAAGQLGRPAVRLLDTEAFTRDWQTAVGTGIRPTQVKDRLFRQDEALWRRLTGAGGG
ncbi:GH3 auxin-responsive promoter family protein [Streptomyces sp. HNM0663]|uniref:GH3 auxin-responsive promoter family protein n=1 Tax=Streptomyces chengmaiensis TaxID=3040919 RepID=A0ABT6HR32_9ACTN|nr:GH3 auxin-responsive promoter family protein [Streptomyces chengmaiensis]MDH2391181.1 GH3 auxin-responsive promoter family protein [Streptomyces chengmaiensis]